MKQTHSVSNRAGSYGEPREQFRGHSRRVSAGEREVAYDLDYDPEPKSAWHVIWTRSNCELLVTEQLQHKGYDVFLPMLTEWMKNEQSRYAIRTPMFRSYVFVYQAIGRHEYLDICKTRGVVTILGQRWDRLASVEEEQIESIRLAVHSSLPCRPYPYLKAGDPVRILRGALANAEGVFVKSDESSGLFVVSIDLLQRSIAVQMDCMDVAPA